jgi:PAS domain S-box-containing protein
MQNIIRQFKEKLDRIHEAKDTGKLKLEMLSDLNRLSTEAEILDFKLQRAQKDKKVLNSLLARTSEDLKKALQEQERQAELLDIMLNTIPALVYFKDEKLRYQMVNDAFLKFSGLSRDEVIGKTVTEVFHHYLPQRNYPELEKQVIRQGRFFYNVEEQIEKKGKKIWVHTNIAPVHNQKGEIIGLIGISWDISSQKDYELQLKNARDQAEEANRIKDRFLANMSHEIRTPLNGILGMAEILSQTTLEEEQQEYLAHLLHSAKHLLGLIEDVFEFSAIDSGKYTPEVNKFYLPSLLEQVSGSFRKDAREKGISFSVKISPEMPVYFTGDKGALRIILQNLLDNAVKFTHDGGVELSVFSEKNKGKDGLLVRFEVKDTGIGIEAHFMNKIFESFSQEDISTTKNYQGTGLGLAISKRLVELLHGEIGVESTRKKGSLFWFTVPLKPHVEEDFDEVKVQEILKSFKVLLVEDNLINQKISRVALEKSGCNLEVANNGKEALEKYIKTPYDLILMDIQMPVMDGLEATRKIREYEQKMENHHAFIVALTANAMELDRKKALDSGMDGFIPKPFNPNKLFKLLHEFIIKK